MATKKLKTLDARMLPQWRAWLAKHHERESEVWLIFHKRHTGVPFISYDDAVDEALCFGWIDSLIRRLDDDRFARKFTPRKPDSKWSDINRQRYARLQSSGRLTAAGIKLAPTAAHYNLPAPGAKLPKYIREALQSNAAAWTFFQELAPSYRRLYIAWIHSAKREETKAKRLQETIAKLVARKKPSMM